MLQFQYCLGTAKKKYFIQSRKSALEIVRKKFYKNSISVQVLLSFLQDF